MIIPQFYIDDIIRNAIKEDINYIDVSTVFVIPETQTGTARFISKADGVVCGLEIAMRVFQLLDDTFTYEAWFKDGDEVKKGDLIAVFSGKTACLLQGERTALNLLQHLSGIATATNACVKAVEGTKASIAETRKTLPGLRALQKYAVTCGGGIANTVAILRQKLGHTVKIEVETRNMDEVAQAVQAGADIIMLDNMSCEQMKEACAFIDGRAVTEASGNVTLENIRKVAETGVDIISLGALTHSVKAFDISMRIDK